MLVKKLHLKPGIRFAVVNAPGGFARTLGKLPAGVRQDTSLTPALDVALLFVLNKKELKTHWPKATASVKADGTVCVDRKTRVITMPGDLRKLLEQNAKARALFDTLSFTNRREYVSWIIEAKRPETRTARLAKTVEGLSKGKRNPTDNPILRTAAR